MLIDSFMILGGRKAHVPLEEEKLLHKDLCLLYEEKQNLFWQLKYHRQRTSKRAWRRNRHRNILILRLKLVNKILKIRKDVARYSSEVADYAQENIYQF